MTPLTKKVLLWTLAATVAYVVSFLFVDRSVDLWVHRHLSATGTEKAAEFISTLAYGAYVKLALAAGFVAVAFSDPRLEKVSTKRLVYVLLSVSVAIIVGEGFKYLLGRYRPVMLFEHDRYGLHFFATQWEMNASPSGHTLRAFSFFTALSLLYRRLTVPFMLAALCIGVSRVVVTVHYPADVLFGAYIGFLSAYLLHAAMFGGISRR